MSQARETFRRTPGRMARQRARIVDVAQTGPDAAIDWGPRPGGCDHRVMDRNSSQPRVVGDFGVMASGRNVIAVRRAGSNFFRECGMFARF